MKSIGVLCGLAVVLAVVYFQDASAVPVDAARPVPISTTPEIDDPSVPGCPPIVVPITDQQPGGPIIWPIGKKIWMFKFSTHRTV